MKRMRLVLLPLSLAATTVAGFCGGGSDEPRPVDTVQPVATTDRVYYDDGPAFTDSVRLVVRDGQVMGSGLRQSTRTWSDVWAQATSSRPTRPPLPNIDFSRHMLLVVGAGRMSPGDRIRVDSAGVRGDRFVAVVRTVEECRPFSASTYPLEIVRVPREQLPIHWEDRREKAAHCM